MKKCCNIINKQIFIISKNYLKQIIFSLIIIIMIKTINRKHSIIAMKFLFFSYVLMRYLCASDSNHDCENLKDNDNIFYDRCKKYIEFDKILESIDKVICDLKVLNDKTCEISEKITVNRGRLNVLYLNLINSLDVGGNSVKDTDNLKQEENENNEEHK
ncbi:hypothetical protein EDEG_01979 [Edhazardia aedis USNM 41457]|uniref:Uncharacterized protein n=1 Tax=Edhazardia aedis (strain USNM 41457) TaxID=1003232 RepID=J9D7I1_EDHAE|nr:hypothetical protein EDEG_01979 [Edhazardia aedis USNM 41457]|eukprot:EJW03741.1 hypothetical protein EDEG_01979 [Edhazardia aedis USNM 41457]